MTLNPETPAEAIAFVIGGEAALKLLRDIDTGDTIKDTRTRDRIAGLVQDAAAQYPALLATGRGAQNCANAIMMMIEQEGYTK